jgi:peptidoglycan/xylan/chitin deacetylase (PgdA/CDA1 family)
MKIPNLTTVMKLVPHLLAASLLGMTLGSCKNADTEAAAEEAAPTKSRPNRSYQAPQPRGPVPRNPDMNLSSSFGKDAGVTFSRVSVGQPFVAMTFDDGPHPQNTPRLLDMLRERNIKATFYVIGRNVDLYPAIARRIVAEGHEIGNHTYNHPNLTKLSDESVSNELTKTRAAIAKATGVQPRTMRPPYGALRQDQRAWIHAKYRYPTVLWSVDPRDWQRPGPSVVTSRILGASSPGSIILAHDLHKPTVDAMPATLDGLLRKGYKFVTVSQLLAMKPAPEAPAQASLESANP